MPDYMKFANSTVYQVKLLADAPEQFEGKYGLQNNYSCECNGKEVIVSQKIGSGLDLYLESGKAGDVFIIEKRQDPANPKNFPFHVEKGQSVSVDQAPAPAQGSKVSSPAQTDWNAVNALKDWNIQRAIAFKEACGFQVGKERNLGALEADFHDLFSIVRNDGRLIVSRIEACKSLVELESLWKDEGTLWVELIGMDKIAVIQKIKEKKVATFPAPKVEPPKVEIPPENDDTLEDLPF